jgi:hypothetical protein
LSGRERFGVLYAEVENWKRHGRVPRYFLSIRRWLHRHQMLEYGAVDADVSV